MGHSQEECSPSKPKMNQTPAVKLPTVPKGQKEWIPIMKSKKRSKETNPITQAPLESIVSESEKGKSIISLVQIMPVDIEGTNLPETSAREITLLLSSNPQAEVKELCQENMETPLEEVEEKDAQNCDIPQPVIECQEEGVKVSNQVLTLNIKITLGNKLRKVKSSDGLQELPSEAETDASEDLLLVDKGHTAVEDQIQKEKRKNNAKQRKNKEKSGRTRPQFTSDRQLRSKESGNPLIESD